MWWKGSTAALLSKGPPSLPCSHFFFFHLILSYTHPKIFFKMHHFTMRFKQGHHSPHHFLHIYICVKKITPFLGKNRTFRFFWGVWCFCGIKKSPPEKNFATLRHGRPVAWCTRSNLSRHLAAATGHGSIRRRVLPSQ